MTSHYYSYENCKVGRVGIHKAIVDGDRAQVQAFIEAGVDINQPDCDHNNPMYPLYLAVLFHHIEIIRILADAGATLFPGLLDIISEDDFCDSESLVVLIEVGIDVNARLEDGETVLMQAALQGKLNIVKMLINAGADPNIVSRNADFALLAAGYARHQDVFEYLIPVTSQNLQAIAAERLPNCLSKLIRKYGCL